MTRNFKYILFAGAVLLAAPALAEENVIKVINEDGSVSVINIGPNGGEPAVLEKKTQETEAVEEKTEAPVQENTVDSDGTIIPSETESVQPDPHAKEQAPLPEDMKKGIPLKTEEIQEEKPAAKKADKKTEKKSSKKKKSVEKKPAEKPEPRTFAPRPALKAGETLTRDEAMAIAIDSTSMISRGMDAYLRTYEGREVWVVVFKTDQGERDILVDPKTGEIVRVKK